MARVGSVSHEGRGALTAAAVLVFFAAAARTRVIAPRLLTHRGREGDFFAPGSHLTQLCHRVNAGSLQVWTHVNV